MNTNYCKYFIAYKGLFVVAEEIAPNAFDLVEIKTGMAMMYYYSKFYSY